MIELTKHLLGQVEGLWVGAEEVIVYRDLPSKSPSLLSYGDGRVISYTSIPVAPSEGLTTLDSVNQYAIKLQNTLSPRLVGGNIEMEPLKEARIEGNKEIVYWPAKIEIVQKDVGTMKTSSTVVLNFQHPQHADPRYTALKLENMETILIPEERTVPLVSMIGLKVYPSTYLLNSRENIGAVPLKGPNEPLDTKYRTMVDSRSKK